MWLCEPRVSFAIFFRYLQEIGYTDAILDVRSSRVRSLLGLTSNDQPNKTKSGEPAKTNHVNDSEAVTSNKPGPIRIVSASPTKDANIAIKRWLPYLLYLAPWGVVLEWGVIRRGGGGVL